MSTEEPTRETKVLTDVRDMRALSHPVRIELLDVLAVHGELTATQAGELIGESPTTCSFHLRQLAKYGFVEEAGGGKGRARPWRRIHHGVRFSSDHEDPEAEIAAGSLARLYRERQFERLQRWLDTRRSYPQEWRNAASNSEFVLWMTPAELEALNVRWFAELAELHRERADDPSTRPADAVPVEYLLYSYPMQPPKGDPS